jgi:hypothetical protein
VDNRNTGSIQWGMTSDDRNVYAAVSDVVRKQLVTGAKVVGGADFDPIQGGGLTALQLKDGNKAWFAPSYPVLLRDRAAARLNPQR